ncbi:MAG: hypothetical protein HUJ25_15595 [Crocinitomicaceae bacterium]|nr:hypothetical protein [Crocinitomicaceae bacterium]
MKWRLLLSLSIILTTLTNSLAQENVKVTIGNENTSFKAYELLPDSTGECSYYTIVGGVFDYFYINRVNGETRQYKHYFCQTKLIDIKSVSYKENPDGTYIMLVSTKKEEPEVMYESWNLFEGKVDKIQDSGPEMTLIVPSPEAGDQLLKLIKKGKDL